MHKKQNFFSAGHQWSVVPLLLVAFGCLRPDAALAQRESEGAPQLNQLIHQVVTQHPTVLMETAFVRAAEQEIDAAQWQRFPTLGMQTERSGGRSGTQISLEQPVWAGGRIEAQIELAKAQAQVQKAQLQESRYQLALRTVDAWVALVQAEERAREINNTIGQLDNYYTMMRRRVDAEISARVELFLIEARTFSARVDLQQARTDRSLARSTLKQLTGKEPADGEWWAGQPLKELTQSAAGLIPWVRSIQDDGIERHPAVKKSRGQTAVAQQESELASVTSWPELYMRLQHKTGAAAVEGERSVFFGLRYQPGAGFSSYSRGKAAALRAQGQELGIEAIRRDLKDTVNADMEGLSSALLRVDALETAVGTSALVLASYERQFVAGKRPWQEVMNAVKENGEHRTALVNAYAAVLNAEYRLRVRLGTLDWQVSP